MAGTEFPSVNGQWRQPRTAHETCGTDGHLRSRFYQMKEQTKLTLFKRNWHRTQRCVRLLPHRLRSFRRNHLHPMPRLMLWPFSETTVPVLPQGNLDLYITFLFRRSKRR